MGGQMPWCFGRIHGCISLHDAVGKTKFVGFCGTKWNRQHFPKVVLLAFWRVPIFFCDITSTEPKNHQCFPVQSFTLADPGAMHRAHRASEQADWLPHGRSQRKKGGQLLQNSKICKFLVHACSKMKKAEPIEPIVKDSIIQGKANRQLHGRLPRNHSWETKCRRQKCQINAVEKIKALPNSVRNSSAARPPMAISITQGRPSRGLGNRAPNIWIRSVSTAASVARISPNALAIRDTASKYTGSETWSLLHSTS